MRWRGPDRGQIESSFLLAVVCPCEVSKNLALTFEETGYG